MDGLREVKSEDHLGGRGGFTLGKFTGKNSVPVFDLFYFQALTVKEGRVRGAMGQRMKRPERESRGRIV